MAVRIIDIDVSGVNRAVDKTALRAIDEIDAHYGHAGIAFVRALFEQGLHQQAIALRERIDKAAREIAGGDNADAAEIRAARPLALLMVAGTMAVGFGLLPETTPVKEAVQWAWRQFKQSLDAAALDPVNAGDLASQTVDCRAVGCDN